MKKSARKTRVLIIGAGPSGSMAALRLCELGFRDFILVDGKKFPRHKPCAGGLSPMALGFLDRTGLSRLLEGTATAEMNSVRLVRPDGREDIFKTGLKGYVLNRKIFDKLLLDEAVKAGAEFIPGFHVSDIILDGSGNAAGATDGISTIDSEMTVICTGGHNRLLRDGFFPDRRPLRRIVSRIGWWDGFNLPDGRLEMVFDRELSPHYGWVFPEGNGRVNIGICLYEDRLRGKSLTSAFGSFLDRHYSEKLKSAKPVGRTYSYPINTSGSVGRLYGGGMLLCGEAGRLCDPATCEGISMALESGRFAAETVSLAFSSGTLDRAALAGYQKLCAGAFNKRLRASSFFSALLNMGLFNPIIDFSSSRLGKKLLAGLV